MDDKPSDKTTERLSYKELAKQRRKEAYQMQKAKAKAFRESPKGQAIRAEQKARQKSIAEQKARQKSISKKRKQPDAVPHDETGEKALKAENLLNTLVRASDLPPLADEKKKDKPHLYVVKD